MKINITKENNTTPLQHFCFYTEDSWKSNAIKDATAFFSGKKNEFFIISKEGKVDFLIGLGSEPKNFEIQEVAAKFAYDFRKKMAASSTLIQTFGLKNEQTEYALIGLFLGTYQYPFRAEHPFYEDDFNLVVPEFSEESLVKIQQRILAFCEGEFACKDWLNKPANYKKVPQITQFLQEIAQKHQFNIQIFNQKKSTELGLGAFLSVNQGSSQEAAFTILEYHSPNKSAKTVGLVGKCVLFDTGGISIKPSENMHYMKSDLGGATAVIGTLIAAAELQLPINLVAILPITDNAVSAEAFLPSDVITAYNGKTIEVLNTDAEGRMTLADGLSYLAKNFETDALIDLATLTGSSVRMFGNTCGALFSNNDQLKNALLQSADKTNQRLWNLPLWDVWKDDFTSEVADFKNISSKPFGDCIVAAKFLEQFIESHPNWAHLDIAGVAFGNTIYSKEKAATGYGIQLLVDFLENL